MNIQLSDHFTYPRLLRFVFPSIMMMIFTSFYGVVDGLFVSNFVGKTSFAAVNLIMPFLMLFGALGFMLGSGGSAIVAKHLGEGERDRAISVFSLLTCVTILCGILLTVVGMFILRPVASLLGATGAMLEDCVSYGRIILIALSAFMLQNLFQSFLVTAERPQFGLYVTVAAGVTNMLLDFLFVAVFSWGIVGAATATAISQAVGGLVPLVYFLHPKNKSLLRLRKPTFDGHALLHTCTNGSSELMTNLSLSFANMLYNFQLMRLVGEDGIAAFGVVMYVSFIFITVFIGYSIGSAPIISYHYGAKNLSELKGLFRKSLVLMSVFGTSMVVLAVLLAKPFSSFFVGYDQELLALTTRGFLLYSLSYLVLGVNIFASAFFTALNNGGVSALLSFLRLFVFQVITLFVFPLFLNVDGVWLSIVGSELLALGMSIFFFLQQRKKYGY